MPSAYQQLCTVFTRLSHFEHLAAICSWDSHTMMPAGGSQARSAAMAELNVIRHQILTGRQVGVWLQQAPQEDLTTDEQANLREMQRHYLNASLLPESLVTEKSLAGARCEHAWRQQRANNDWRGFSENWQQVVHLSRQEAQLRADATQVGRYDALLNLYEPGLSSTTLDQIFADLKQWLPDLLQRVVAKQQHENILRPQGPFDINVQRELGLQVMSLLGFDFNRGRVDISAHPFCGGVPQDVRITTRYNPQEFISSLMGIIHETGHARYEQNLPHASLGQPIALARSMSIHESQSLLCEMQLALSPEFLRLLHPLVIAAFGEQPALEQNNFIRLNQRVNPGLIRVEADEVSYPLHIILRYEIEKALIEGEIEVTDVPALWDEKMQHYLGINTVGHFRDGCLQDIHWTDGTFGYFPTYTLGAMYAAQLFHTVRERVPNLDQSLAEGDLSPLFNWLKTHIWQQGSRYSTDELITKATGETLNPRYFRQHLQHRYL